MCLTKYLITAALIIVISPVEILIKPISSEEEKFNVKVFSLDKTGWKTVNYTEIIANSTSINKETTKKGDDIEFGIGNVKLVEVVDWDDDERNNELQSSLGTKDLPVTIAMLQAGDKQQIGGSSNGTSLLSSRHNRYRKSGKLVYHGRVMQNGTVHLEGGLKLQLNTYKPVEIGRRRGILRNSHEEAQEEPSILINSRWSDSKGKSFTSGGSFLSHRNKIQEEPLKRSSSGSADNTTLARGISEWRPIIFGEMPRHTTSRTNPPDQVELITSGSVKLGGFENKAEAVNEIEETSTTATSSTSLRTNGSNRQVGIAGNLRWQPIDTTTAWPIKDSPQNEYVWPIKYTKRDESSRPTKETIHYGRFVQDSKRHVYVKPTTLNIPLDHDEERVVDELDGGIIVAPTKKVNDVPKFEATWLSNRTTVLPEKRRPLKPDQWVPIDWSHFPKTYSAPLEVGELNSSRGLSAGGRRAIAPYMDSSSLDTLAQKSLASDLSYTFSPRSVYQLQFGRNVRRLIKADRPLAATSPPLVQPLAVISRPSQQLAAELMKRFRAQQEQISLAKSRAAAAASHRKQQVVEKRQLQQRSSSYGPAATIRLPPIILPSVGGEGSISAAGIGDVVKEVHVSAHVPRAIVPAPPIPVALESMSSSETGQRQQTVARGLHERLLEQISKKLPHVGLRMTQIRVPIPTIRLPSSSASMAPTRQTASVLVPALPQTTTTYLTETQELPRHTTIMRTTQFTPATRTTVYTTDHQTGATEFVL